jgi:hypothetical protein
MTKMVMSVAAFVKNLEVNISFSFYGMWAVKMDCPIKEQCWIMPPEGCDLACRAVLVIVAGAPCGMQLMLHSLFEMTASLALIVLPW